MARMANKRVRRLRRKARAQMRELERKHAAAAELRPIAIAAIRYVTEIYAPNIKEPFSIFNRRMDLVEVVRAYQRPHAQRAARAEILSARRSA